MANERGNRFRSLAEIGHVPPRVPTIAGVLAPGEIALLTGAPKSGKSTLAAGLAASVSRGGPFLGRPCKPGPVAYLAAERGGGISRRLRAAGADERNAFVAEWSPLLIEEADQIVDAIGAKTEAPALIVLDTLARCIAGADENSSRDMGLAVKALARIQAAFPTAATVVSRPRHSRLARWWRSLVIA
ncbi:MAG: helicase RepA family protein [Loktanella sp.]|nr:helicase RepA family protein [Loktanella sp.]